VLKQGLQESAAALKHYEWVETTTMSMGGEVKSTKENRCYYDAHGKLTKVATGGTSAGKSPGGLRGKAAAKKKGEIGDAMEQAVALVHSYIPPDAAKIQAARDAGRLAIRPPDAQGRTGVDIKDYLKPGDQLSIDMDAKTNQSLSMAISSYSTAQDKDPVACQVKFDALPDGTIHESVTTLDLKGQNVNVKVENGGYRKM